MDMSKPERARVAVRYIAKKQNKSQQEIGVLLGYNNKASISAILNGKSRYFPENLPERIAALDPDINIDFLNGVSDYMLLSEIPADEQAKTPAKAAPATGGVYVPPEFVALLAELSATVRSQQETIRQLLADISTAGK